MCEQHDKCCRDCWDDGWQLYETKTWRRGNLLLCADCSSREEDFLEHLAEKAREEEEAKMTAEEFERHEEERREESYYRADSGPRNWGRW
jgi:hypothetical protein